MVAVRETYLSFLGGSIQYLNIYIYTVLSKGPIQFLAGCHALFIFLFVVFCVFTCYYYYFLLIQMFVSLPGSWKPSTIVLQVKRTLI